MMVYCPKCGNKNPDDSVFCNKCGTTISGPPVHQRRMKDDKCEEECHGSEEESRRFWGVIVVLVGLWLIFEFGIKNIEGIPDAVKDFEFWWIFPVLIGLIIIISGIKILSKRPPRMEV